MNLFKYAAAALLATAAPAGAAVQIVENGILTGATGVDVGGVFYNVAFVDGTCTQIYGVCATSNLDFTDASVAQTAAFALLNQVFLDTSAGLFDSVPNLTRGCSSITICAAFVPYQAEVERFGTNINAMGLGATNYTPSSVDIVEGGGHNSEFNTGDDSRWVYARFTLSNPTGAVPEPSTWAMMLMGFGSMGVALRRRKRTGSLPQTI